MRPTAPKLDKDGFPIPQGFDEAGLEDPTASRAATMRRVRWVLRMALVAGLLGYAWVHFEVGKHISNEIGLHFGQEARRLYLHNDLPRALEAADRAVRWSPKNVDLLMTRAELKYLNKDYEGSLADAKQAIILSPQDLHAHRMQRQLFHLLARHREAATAATELLAHGIEDEAELLNSRAYSRALGDFELEDAERDIEKALKLATLAGPLRQLADSATFAEARAALFEIQRVVHEQTLVLPLWQLNEYAARRTRVTMSATPPLSLYQFVAQWRTTAGVNEPLP